MKTRLIVGDYHGRLDVFKKIYYKENPNDVIMLGDYVDSHDNINDNEQEIALKELLNIKRSHTNGDFIMLIGNHDYQYYYNNHYEERYSGFSFMRLKWAHPLFVELIKSDVLQCIYIDDLNKTIYSHAGVTNTWLKLNNIEVTDVNNAMKDDTKKNVFRFSLGIHPRFSGNGDSIDNSCIWVRPYSLLDDMYIDEDNYMWTQIVGHTPVKQISGFKNNNVTDNLLDINLMLTDNLPFQYVLETLDDNGIVIDRKSISI